MLCYSEVLYFVILCSYWQGNTDRLRVTSYSWRRSGRHAADRYDGVWHGHIPQWAVPVPEESVINLRLWFRIMRSADHTLFGNLVVFNNSSRCKMGNYKTYTVDWSICYMAPDYTASHLMMLISYSEDEGGSWCETFVHIIKIHGVTSPNTTV
jgi:hypothetical protein